MSPLVVYVLTHVCRPVSKVYVSRSQSGDLFAYARTTCVKCQRFYRDEPLEIVQMGKKTKIHEE